MTKFIKTLYQEKYEILASHVVSFALNPIALLQLK